MRVMMMVVMLLVLLMMMTIMMLTRQGEGVQVCEIGVGMIRAQFRYTSSVFTSSPITIVPKKTFDYKERF